MYRREGGRKGKRNLGPGLVDFSRQEGGDREREKKKRKKEKTRLVVGHSYDPSFYSYE